MRTAKDIVEEYRARGYPDDRIRTLANNRDEPMRSAILACLTVSEGRAGECELEGGENDVDADDMMREEDLVDPVPDESDTLAADDVEDADADGFNLMDGEDLPPECEDAPETGMAGVSALDEEAEDFDGVEEAASIDEVEDVEAETSVEDDEVDMDQAEAAADDHIAAENPVDDVMVFAPESGADAVADAGAPVEEECAVTSSDEEGAADAADMDAEGVSEADLVWMAELEEVDTGLEDAAALDEWVENVLEEAGLTQEDLAAYAESTDDLHASLADGCGVDGEGECGALAVDDLACSAEMIREAYRRAGVQLADGRILAPLDEEHITPETYFARLHGGEVAYSEEAIRATLQVIRCEEMHAEGDASGIIELRPAYAVERAASGDAPEDAGETGADAPAEGTIAFSMETFEARGVADVAREVFGLPMEEELLLPCADFDQLARPRQVGESRADAPDERSLLAQWWFDLDSMGARPAAPGSLPEQTTAEMTWEEERAAWRDEMATLQRKLENAGESLTLQTLLADEREEARRELESRVAELSRELEALQGTTHELEVHAAHVQEVESLLDAARMELDAVSHQFETMERAHNIAVTETIPNLQADKADLVELIHEQEEEGGTIRDELQSYRRRASYSMVAAAAASLLVVLLPVFHFVASPEAVTPGPDPILMAQLRQKDDAVEAMEAERQGLVAQVRELETRYRQEQTHWENRLTAMTLRGEERVRDLQTKLQALEGELVALREASGAGNAGERLASGDLPYNDIVGVEAWRRRQGGGGSTPSGTHTTAHGDTSTQGGAETADNRAAGDTTTVAAAQPRVTRTATVRRGEGLSQVLWREMGSSTPALVRHVTKENNLRTDRNGNPVIHPGQKLVLPRAEEAALLR